MKHYRKIAVGSLASAALILGACGNSSADKQVPENLQQVNSILVKANSCQAGIQQALAQRSIGVTDNAESADATLQVSVTSEGRNLDDIPEFGGIGSKASYTASLSNADGKVLFSTAGDEGSVTYNEVCEDIGDEIAERMQDQGKS